GDGSAVPGHRLATEIHVYSTRSAGETDRIAGRWIAALEIQVGIRHQTSYIEMIVAVARRDHELVDARCADRNGHKSAEVTVQNDLVWRRQVEKVIFARAVIDQCAVPPQGAGERQRTVTPDVDVAQRRVRDVRGSAGRAALHAARVHRRTRCKLQHGNVDGR